jgi:acetyl esterase/lipase
MESVDAKALLDPEIAKALDGFTPGRIDEGMLSAMRVQLPALGTTDAVERTEHVVPFEDGVPVRVHRPKDAAGALPCAYSIHGGGFVIGSYDMDDERFERWCPQLGIAGVSVEYRLAPDTRYPGPLEDCYQGLKWTYENSDALGFDPTRIGVCGVSAGGGLAAALVLLARDRGEIPVAFQLLDCPMLDDRQRTLSSQLDGLIIWTRESNEFGWRSYLGDLYGVDDVPYHAAPARATELGGLPPSFVSVGAVDGFRDECIDYAMRLNQAGVPTELHVYPGAPHGYQIAADSSVARQSARDVEHWITRQVQ